MGKTLKIVIVEDEPISSAYLKNLLKETGIDHKVLATLASVADAKAYFLKNADYDLLFIDIHLGDGTCFDLLNATNIKKPIIFCTTFDTYAIKAFRYNSIDYILKPIKKEDVRAALNKYYSIQKSEENAYLMRIDKMMDSFVSTRPLNKARRKIRVDSSFLCTMSLLTDMTSPSLESQEDYK